MSEKTPKPPVHKWTAKGRNDASIKASATGYAAADDNIDIYEVPRSFEMGGEESDDPYGVPITPKGALGLMARFIKVLQKAGVSPKVPLPLPPEGKIEDLTSPDEIMKAILVRLVASYGMSFDRGVLLKIISQPTCEGVRLYHCLKNVKGTDYLSMVLVGVDAEGNDLHFETTQLQDIEENSTTDKAVKSNSLLSEYAHPPTLKFLEKVQHSLLLLALEQAQHPAPQTQANTQSTTESES